jgi:putative transposase
MGCYREPSNKEVLGIHLSLERNMIVAEQFLKHLVIKYGKHKVSSDGSTWYPSQACKFLKLKHHIHSSFEKSVIERTVQYFKDRTESFDDYFPCTKKKRCKLYHVCVYIYYRYTLEKATGKARSLIIDFVDSSNDYPKF